MPGQEFLLQGKEIADATGSIVEQAPQDDDDDDLDDFDDFVMLDKPYIATLEKHNKPEALEK